MFRFFSLIVFLVFLSSAEANITVYPTAAHFDQSKSMATLSVKNSSKVFMSYKIEAVYFVPGADGKMSMAPAGSDQERSIVKLMRFSPKSVSLKPGEEQVVRIMVKASKKLEPGDYRAHVRFSQEDAMTNNLVMPKKKTGMQLDAKIAVSIPALLRIEPTPKQITLEDFKIYQTPEGPRFKVNLKKQNNHYYPYGEFRLKAYDKDGKEFDLGLVKGIQSFKQESTYDFQLSSGENLKNAAKATIQYVETFNGGEEKIADATLVL